MIQPKQSCLYPKPGFTLVELMIAIALSLLLVVGINALFKSTADTVGTGQELLSDARELRNAFETLDADFAGFLDGTSQPVLMIYNTNLPAFRDKTDEKSDADWVPATPTYESILHTIPGVRSDKTNAGTVPLVADNRNHRLDILSFFSSGHFRRQTAEQNDASKSSYQSLYSSDKAYVWYGHVRQPDANVANWQTPGTFLPPGIGGDPGNKLTAATNPNGFYANQWVLGHMAILLGQPSSANVASPAVAGPSIIDSNSVAQAYLLPPAAPDPTVTPTPTPTLEPFQAGSVTSYNGNSPYLKNSISGIQIILEDSLVDLAGIGSSDFFNNTRDNSVLLSTGARKDAWYTRLLSTNTVAAASATPASAMRFACKPWSTRNSANTAAQTRTDIALSSPAFIHGCSQFIVEFAGDYFEQNSLNGNVAGQRSDGVLDFTFDSNSNRRVRWYGMARRYSDSTTPLNVLDVQPVYKTPGATSTLPFEKTTSSSSNYPVPSDSSFPATKDPTTSSYVCVWSPHDFQWPSGTPITAPANGSLSTSMSASDPYVNVKVNAGTAFGGFVTLPTAYPNGFMPWMIRLTIRVDGIAGHLQDGQTIQYIFNLPHP